VIPRCRCWSPRAAARPIARSPPGCAVVALAGVWGWRGSNGRGGKLAVADWHDIALNGRRVVLAFDSDAAVKTGVRQALGELGAYLATRGATAGYLHLPDPGGDGKTGLDDYLAAEGPAGIWALVRPDPPALREKEPAAVAPAGGSAISGHTPRAVLAGGCREGILPLAA